MSKTTKLMMRKIRRKMTRWEGLSLTACGYEMAVQRSRDARFELEDFIEKALEELERGNPQP